MSAPVGALNVKDAARYLGISVRSLYRLTAECGTGPDALSVVHINGRRVFRIRDLDAFLDRHVVRGGRRTA